MAKQPSVVHEIDDEEDARLTAAAEADPDNPPLTEDDLVRMRPITDFPDLAETFFRGQDDLRRRIGRPPLPEAEKKRRVTMYLDPDVVDRLKEGGRGWQTRANQKLREALGL